MKTHNTQTLLWQSSLLATLFLITPLHAEIILDGTLGGPRGILNSSDVSTASRAEGLKVFPITASLGKQVGDNLFHSFETFNLQSHEIASFAGPDSIQNVISRVTGNHASYINGTLHSSMPKADLYFLNPAGILFGPNARLSVSGSFHASTADYLRLGEDGRFDATHPEASLLKVAPPTAFGFLNDSPAGISKQGGFLIVPPRKTLSFIGGDLNIADGQFLVEQTWRNSFMGASAGRINLISVAASFEVPIHPENMPDNAFEQFGQITITDSTPVGKHSERQWANLDVSGAAGGSVYIRGGQIVMDNGYIWADTRGHENGQGITIKATDELALTKGSRITAQVVKKGELTPTGHAGNLNLTANRILISGGSQIDSSTQIGTAGSAGHISISAQEALKISGCLVDGNGHCLGESFKTRPDGFFYSGIQSSSGGRGQGGNIRIETPRLTLTENGVIRADTQNIGEAGEIAIQVDTLSLTNGAQIKSSSGYNNPIQATGSGGLLTIKAHQTIEIKGKGMEGQASGIFSNAFTQGEGGKIEISAPTASLESGGTIQAAAEGQGKAGSMVFNVDKLTLHNSTLVTHSVDSAGGDITIKSSEQLYLVNSGISTQAIGVEKQNRGGNITLSQPYFMILDNSQLITSGFVGDGGNISLSAKHSIQSSDSVLNAASTLGIDGTIQIDASIEEFNEISVLPAQFRQPPLSLNDCVIRTPKEISRFKHRTRSGLSNHPNELQH
ncbi:MAG: filamentous hemagglutinin N-terminal domain-containing protein [Candidatus Parabeggiatoa sp.]|nr:filamentous hemagglutinin N-terminal domain-containing protein [Candidatus Parabeggiatoa sp.]